MKKSFIRIAINPSHQARLESLICADGRNVGSYLRIMFEPLSEVVISSLFVACKLRSEVQIEPVDRKRFVGSLLFRCESSLKDKLAGLSSEDGRTVSNYLRIILERLTNDEIISIFNTSLKALNEKKG
jgi:predicted DNA-binding protein